jgi:zinc and cadmium transporter
MTLILIIAFVILGSIGSVGISAFVLLFREHLVSRVIAIAIPYSIGTLLGAAFLGMIPHAQKELPGSNLSLALLFGFILFFTLEKIAVWRHCHEDSCLVHTRAGLLILIGDSLHNFVDGIAIASAFLYSSELGTATALAVIAHEIPQEVGDFAVLLESGYSRSRALLFNVISSTASFPGAIAAYFLLPEMRSAVPYFLAISASSFIYIALADLVPGRRATGGIWSLAWELPLIILGIGTIALL